MLLAFLWDKPTQLRAGTLSPPQPTWDLCAAARAVSCLGGNQHPVAVAGLGLLQRVLLTSARLEVGCASHHSEAGTAHLGQAGVSRILHCGASHGLHLLGSHVLALVKREVGQGGQLARLIRLDGGQGGCKGRVCVLKQLEHVHVLGNPSPNL